jgi:glycosyltransferase involved in cell wall biosynthesis
MLWRASSVIVSNSFTVAEEARGLLGIPDSRLRVIPNGVDLERFRPDGSKVEAREAIGLGRWNFLVGMVARYSPVKDHETLLRALSMVQKTGDWPPTAGVLFVGGTTYRETRDRVEAQIREAGLESDCEARGVTSDVVGVYHALDWLVLPSRHEGFPNTVLEAMACGRPVIVSSAANAEGLVVEGKTGFLFPTGNAEALADCLRKALTLPEENRQAMGRAARTETEQRFSSIKMVDRYEALYDELLGKGQDPPCM